MPPNEGCNKCLADRYRRSVCLTPGLGDSVYAVMESHYKVIGDFQTLFRTVRKRITGIDTEQAANTKTW